MSTAAALPVVRTSGFQIRRETAAGPRCLSADNEEALVTQQACSPTDLKQQFALDEVDEATGRYKVGSPALPLQDGKAITC